ncbi:Uncharacterized protein FWK35_00033075 [Aphis craccivora]|uniref:Uncharacterized protein n=1 Tax=Aphis craccivora TaxID=307492 RepID=A0A6G0YIA3_APHCR|nr:Uncharacterized protein FWK35_00033075 [Aphis craccivora]
MICVVFFVFVSIYSITYQKNASFSNFGTGFRWQSEYPWYIIEVKNKNFPIVFKKNRHNFVYVAKS